MKLTHIGISNFRSIGPEPVMIDLSKKVTILVGQNDCGKSNVLRGIEIACDSRGRSSRRFDTIDRHGINSTQPPLFHLYGENHDRSSVGYRRITKLRVDLEFEVIANGHLVCRDLDDLELDELHDIQHPEAVFHPRFPRTPEEQRIHHQEEQLKTTKIIAQTLVGELPQAMWVPQFRRIENGESYRINGPGVISLLAQWQHPSIGDERLQEKFKQVEELLALLLEVPAISLEVPHTKDQIIVVHGTLRLPLESHGTGIHQLIILAIAALSQDNVIFGIEEPEVHLHPVLQKRFLDFLRKETNNNYIITTHSPALIAPADDVDVIHLKMVDGVTLPHHVKTDAGTLAALQDLGIRPSDLLQANCVIWVEGPSDRIYIKRWLELLAPDLTEGIDYTIMFYGGRLLSHLSLVRDSDPEIDHLIQLLRINQHSAIVMDSDRKALSDPLNATKQRIISECETSGLHYWVTKGKEIENYLPTDVVNAALFRTHQHQEDFKVAITGKFDQAFKRAAGGSQAPKSCHYEDHKTTWAHRFADEMTKDKLTDDIREDMKRLIDFIKTRLQQQSCSEA